MCSCWCIVRSWLTRLLAPWAKKALPQPYSTLLTRQLPDAPSPSPVCSLPADAWIVLARLTSSLSKKLITQLPAPPGPEWLLTIAGVRYWGYRLPRPDLMAQALVTRSMYWCEDRPRL